MDKKYVYLGLGLVAVGGLAYYFLMGRGSGAKSLSSGTTDSTTPPLTDGANSTPTRGISRSWPLHSPGYFPRAGAKR